MENTFIQKLAGFRLGMRDVFAAFCAAFCMGNLAALFYAKGKASFASLDYLKVDHVFLVLASVTLTAFALLMMVSFFFRSERPIRAALLLSAVAVASFLADLSTAGDLNIAFAIGLALVLYLVVEYSAGGVSEGVSDISARTMWIAIGLLAALVGGVVTYYTLLRHWAYQSSAFDFGIFAQMFESMRTTGLPMVTCERNRAMSHFGVHFSPFFYLLLPIYCLFPRPETLLVMQAWGIVSAVVPTALICRRCGLSRKQTLLVSVVCLFLPPFLCPSLYDFHENKFLALALLWCACFMLKKKYIPFAIFAAMTLSIKEDAAIYVIALALFMIFSEKERKAGTITLLAAIGYFVFATKMVSYFGGEVMVGRLEAFIPEGGGLLSVIRTCVTDIGYLIYKVFTQEKLRYVITVLLPFAFLPLLPKKKSSLLLFVPMLVINLMPEYDAQYSIYFQYSYGSVALVLLLYILVLMEVSDGARRKILAFSTAVTVVLFHGSFVHSAKVYSNLYHDPGIQARTEAYDELLDSLPRDMEITVNTYFAGHMYDFTCVYIFPNYFGEQEATEYALVKEENIQNPESEISLFLKDRYEVVRNENDAYLYRLKKEYRD